MQTTRHRPRSHSLATPPAILVLTLALALGGCARGADPAPPNDPDREEWIQLFDGRDLDGWIVKINHHDVGDNFAGTFRVADGAIQVRYDGYGEFDDQFGHLYYRQPFSYYHLVVEYRLLGDLYPGAPDYALRNSGVMFHSQDPQTILRDQDWPIAVELQILGGLGDGNPRPTGNVCTPGTDITYRGETYPDHCLESASETYDGDRWVRVEALVLGDSLVRHIVEGDTVLTYSEPRIGGGVVSGFDPAVKRDGTPLTGGFIALQSEGQPVDFRRVELLNLEGCTDPRATNYKRYYVASDSTACTYDD